MVGVVSTLIATQFLKRLGKVNVFVKNWDVTTSIVSSGRCEVVKATSYDNDNYYINLNMELYNSSEVPKIMRDIKILFYNKKKQLFNIIPNDKENCTVLAGQFHEYHKVKVLNLESKKCIIKELSFGIDKADNEELFNKLNQVNKIYLEYTNEKNRVKRELIGNKLL